MVSQEWKHRGRMAVALLSILIASILIVSMARLESQAQSRPLVVSPPASESGPAPARIQPELSQPVLTQPVLTQEAGGSPTVIVLRDGSRFLVDEVREQGGRYIYRMGSMQGFLDGTEVVTLLAPELPDHEAAVTRETSGLAFTTGHGGLDRLIIEAAARHQLDPLLIYLVMREESGFNHRAVSRAGARGLMQLMPATARRLGIQNIHNPRENVEAGTRYLRWLIETFDGDVNLALAAYNAGEGAVRRYGRRIPPYAETRRYVWRINTAYRRLSPPVVAGR